jgi:hypothetical protein
MVLAISSAVGRDVSIRLLPSTVVATVAAAR